MWNDSPGTEPRDLKRCQRGITWQEYFSFWCDCKTCCSSCGQKLLANYLEQLIIQMSSVVTGITIQMGPHMWTLRWLVDARFLSLVSSGHTFTPWQLFFFGDKWSCKTNHHVHHDHHGQGYFLLAKTSFSGTSMLKTSVVVCAKGKGGCLDRCCQLLPSDPSGTPNNSGTFLNPSWASLSPEPLKTFT